MYKTRRRVALMTTYVTLAVSFILLAFFLVPQTKVNDFRTYSNIFPIVVTGVLFCLLLLAGSTIYSNLRQIMEKRTMETGETALLDTFITKLRFCYSLDDFTTLVATVLETQGDCSVLYVDRATNYILYNSPSRLASASETIDAMRMNFAADWKDGIYFLGDNLGIVSSSRTARGFFIASGGQHLFVYCKYTRLFDNEIYPRLFEEFKRFQARTKTISSLSEISELSKEWEQLAAAQQSFLPAVMPEVKNVSFGAYFRPLINVSGDYYTVLPIDEHKTLLMLGDVSGKGLAAALVMGLVMNTVKILENKSDLPAMIKAVDKAIKSMSLQDKYTVLFLGIVDTSAMTISYVNASMSDPIVITRTPSGYKIKPLTSNCSVVGIIDIPDVQVATQKLYRGDVILMASDGVSEVMDDSGTELGDTELYKNTLCSSAKKHPKEFVDDIVDLVLSYNGGKKLRDDVTMMVAKVVD